MPRVRKAVGRMTCPCGRSLYLRGGYDWKDAIAWLKGFCSAVCMAAREG